MIFVDTGAWFSTFVPNDPHHQEAYALYTSHPGPMVTTDYVVDELLTLLKMRQEYDRSLDIGDELFAGTIVRIEWVAPVDVRRAWRVFRSYQDKQWSFTDCVSRIVMQRLNIRETFAFDEYFRQFGTVTVLP